MPQPWIIEYGQTREQDQGYSDEVAVRRGALWFCLGFLFFVSGFTFYVLLRLRIV